MGRAPRAVESKRNIAARIIRPPQAGRAPNYAAKMVLFLAACAPSTAFPCTNDEWLAADGVCHAAPDDASASDSDSASDYSGEDSGLNHDDSGSEDSGTDDTGIDDSGADDSGTIAEDGWPQPFVAPYVDATGYPTVKVGEIPLDNGIYHYTLGFVVASAASDCTASWGTYYTIETGPSAWESGSEYFLYEQIESLRTLGGDVMVSFGGAANTPIEAACSSVEAVVAEYKRVIEQLNLTRVDFDIEGSWLVDSASIERRSAAIVQLQSWATETGRPLQVWYTLPVLPTGLTADGISVVESAIFAGVELHGVNVMTMDYGDGVAPNPEGQMGEYGIEAIEGVHTQLGTLFPAKTASEVWAMIGSTPMIGQNDVQSERFDLEDAAETVAFAKSVGVGMLGYWSINRDHPCAETTEWASSACSGYADVPDWAFAEVFATYAE